MIETTASSNSTESFTHWIVARRRRWRDRIVGRGGRRRRRRRRRLRGVIKALGHHGFDKIHKGCVTSDCNATAIYTHRVDRGLDEVTLRKTKA